MGCWYCRQELTLLYHNASPGEPGWSPGPHVSDPASCSCAPWEATGEGSTLWVHATLMGDPAEMPWEGKARPRAVGAELNFIFLSFLYVALSNTQSTCSVLGYGFLLQMRNLPMVGDFWSGGGGMGGRQGDTYWGKLLGTA